MAAPALAPGLQRKLRKVLDLRTESPEIANSLSTLSTFYVQNTVNSRRHLRSIIENEALKVNVDFLTATQDIIAALETVQSDLTDVARCCERMSTSIMDNKASTAALLLETERLQHALQVSENRSRLVDTFLSNYQLSAGELQALQSETMTADFFDALAHAQAIHKNCKALLRTHHQRAGLELLDSMATLQEGAYERLCRWVQVEFRSLSDFDAPQIHPLLQKAVAALRSRPVLFKYCAEELAAARQSAVFQRFIYALTRGTRPIEMHAPDPWRYASDMMAWVHTSLASEHEFLVTLLDEGDEPGTFIEEIKDANNGATTSEKANIAELLDIVFDGVCRPLRVRVEQVLMSSPPPLLSFRLAQLMTFYLQTVDHILGVSSQLSDTLRACRAVAMRTFNEHVKHRGDKLRRYPPSPPADLVLPEAFTDGVELVSNLIGTYESSLLTERRANEEAAVANEEDPIDIDAVLKEVLDPLVAAVERSSEALNPKATGRLDDGSHLNPVDQHIYLVNCLHALQRPLMGHACASKRLQILRSTEESQIGAMVRTEVVRIAGSCGLGEIAERFRLYGKSRQAGGDSGGSPPAADPALALQRVADVMRTFFGRLSDPAALPEFRKLHVPLLKTEVVQRSLKELAVIYAEVYDALMDPENAYSPAEVATAVRHTPPQVRTLLGVP